ncbi:MAG: YkoF family thiamine/hydroxymethylpyrimidine-binding protein [Steroidobacteraceae bacterium]
MEIAVEISLYPLHDEYIPFIKEFIARLNAHAGLHVITNHLSTQVFGDHDRIFEVLRQEMATSFAASGKAIFVTKFIGNYTLLPDA